MTRFRLTQSPSCFKRVCYGFQEAQKAWEESSLWGQTFPLYLEHLIFPSSFFLVPQICMSYGRNKLQYLWCTRIRLFLRSLLFNRHLHLSEMVCLLSHLNGWQERGKLFIHSWELQRIESLSWGGSGCLRKVTLLTMVWPECPESGS